MLNNKKYFETNLKRWNELVEINAKSKSYDLPGFLEGNSSLFPIEVEEIGNVKGKTLLHLQCHFGMDTLSWARLGAKVTGVDFSNKAIELAKDLSNRLNIPARFILSNVYDIPEVLEEKFDIVFTSYGTICWLPDLVQWAQIISDCLNPGGIFYIIDGHPFGFIIDEKKNPFNVGFNYFSEGKPVFFDENAAYADPLADLKNQATFEWDHPMSEIINSLIKANLEIEFLHEFPFTFFSIHPDMKKREDGYWEFINYEYTVPMMFSIKTHKKF